MASKAFRVAVHSGNPVIVATPEMVNKVHDIILSDRRVTKIYLSYDVASGSEITACNKICRPLVVYRFTGTL